VRGATLNKIAIVDPSCVHLEDATNIRLKRNGGNVSVTQASPRSTNSLSSASNTKVGSGTAQLNSRIISQATATVHVAALYSSC
jgi:hypothetical protein